MEGPDVDLRSMSAMSLVAACEHTQAQVDTLDSDKRSNQQSSKQNKDNLLDFPPKQVGRIVLADNPRDDAFPTGVRIDVV